MRVLLELLRIILIFLILGGFLGSLVGTLYSEFGIDMERFGWTLILGIYGILFVLYRNKWQFSGWYKGKGREKLPTTLSRFLIVSSVILILLPPILHIILGL